MNDRIEEILRNPSVLKTADGQDFTDDTAAKWAWFAHGYDTGMEPFYSIDQLREAVRSVAAPQAEARQEPLSLHPRTADLVDRFALALKGKLAAAERKYGYSDGWTTTEWMDECREHLRKHLEKGDPRDVAAYCAFLWHHGEPTAKPDSVYSAQPKGEAATARDALHDAATSLETIASLAGRKTYGSPPIETYMDTFMDVRLYAKARANVAREALAALSSTPAQGEGGTGGLAASDENYAGHPECEPHCAPGVPAPAENLAGAIAYQLTKRLVIDMPTARAAVDEALRNVNAARSQEDGYRAASGVEPSPEGFGKVDLIVPPGERRTAKVTRRDGAPAPDGKPSSHTTEGEE